MTEIIISTEEQRLKVKALNEAYDKRYQILEAQAKAILKDGRMKVSTKLRKIVALGGYTFFDDCIEADNFISVIKSLEESL